MKKVFALFLSVSFAVAFCGLMHLATYLWLSLEVWIGNQVSYASATVIDYAATSAGYVRPELELGPDPTETDVLLYASRECMRYGIAPALCRGIVHTESNLNEFAVSPAGAIGVMQIMPANLDRCGLKTRKDRFDMRKNIQCGVRLFHEALEANHWDITLALYEYNGGRNAALIVPKCGSDRTCMGYRSPAQKGFAESYEYAKAVLKQVGKDLS